MQRIFKSLISYANAKMYHNSFLSDTIKCEARQAQADVHRSLELVVAICTYLYRDVL